MRPTAVLLLLMGTLPTSSPEPVHDSPDLAPGVSWALAEHRARTLSAVRYEVALSVPAEREAPIAGRVVVRFRLSEAGDPVVLDFRQPAERIRSVRVGGVEVAYEAVNGHIVVPAGALRVGENAVEVAFVAGDAALNRNDGYLYTLFVPDRASVAFPCFDQPNLKARFTLELETPASWEVAANGPRVRHERRGGRAVHGFAETRPISTYLFAFAAGEFRVETAVRDGRELRMLHRETDEAKLRRNREAIFDLHHAALAWLEEYTEIAYPFEKFDFVLIPSFQFGGMEHPGAVLYNAASLLLDESATQSQELGRASLIAHETAHMWFGDLVTMQWFDDVWTKEVFANFMAAKIVNPSFPDVNHDLRFLLAHYPRAYEVDRTEGANPIRQPLENLNEAGSLYGAIIYQKAPIVMRQLEAMVGPGTFRDGLREYLRRHAYGNASWPDLIEILDRLSPKDLHAWSRVWVEEPGRPTVTTELDVRDGRIAALRLVAADPRGRGRVWTQRLHVLVAGPDTVLYLPVLLGDGPAEVPEAVGLPAPEYVLANGRGLGYGRFRPDPASLGRLLRALPGIPDPVARGVAWLTLHDAMLEGEVAPRTLLSLGMAALESETNELNAQRLVRDVASTYWRLLSPAEREAHAPELEALLWGLMERAATSSQKAMYFGGYRSIARTAEAVERLEQVWGRTLEIPGLRLGETDYTRIAMELAVREVPRSDEILREQMARIENPDRRARFAFVRPALSADPAERDAFFERLRDPANRAREAWVLEAVSYLHHPLRSDHAERYIGPSLELVEEIQRTGDIFFPKRWLDATLGGHRSPRAAAAVREFLAARPDYPPRLRGKILQAADGLFRAARLGAAADTTTAEGANRT